MIVPSEETVVYARTFLNSRLRVARYAAASIVKPPKAISVVFQIGSPPRVGCRRMTRKTPALTIVEECSRAETGEGASIALGSQKWNGNWADFVNAPSSTRMTAGV